MTYQLGIDFGTTFTSAAVSRDGRVEAVNLGTRSMVVPSVVLVRSDGERLIGDAAENRAVVEPNRVAREFKRRLGDPTPLFLGGTPYSAEALIGYVLESVYQRVVERMGERPTAVVITHPAAYSQYRLDLLRDAARRAGIGDARFVPEPEAAAIYYASQARVGRGEVIAMFDLGGGTFDTALLRRLETRFELIGTPQGLERLGGVDFDDALVGFVNDQLGGALSDFNESDPQTMIRLGRLRTDARSAKEALSEDDQAVVQVILPSGAVDVRITRQQFESLIRPRLGEALQALDRAISSAGLTMADVSRIVLVGGSSRIPLVRQIVAQSTGRPLATDIDPEHAVSMGAAFAASGRSLTAVDSSGQMAIVPPTPNPNPPGFTGPGRPGAGPPPVPLYPTGQVPLQPQPYVAQGPPQQTPAQQEGPPQQFPRQPSSSEPYSGQSFSTQQVPPRQPPPPLANYVQPVAQPPVQPPAQSKTRLVVILGAAAVLLAAIVAFALTRGNDNNASTSTTAAEHTTNAPDSTADSLTTEPTTEPTTTATTDSSVADTSTATDTTAATATTPETVTATAAPTAPPTAAPTAPPDPNAIAQQQLDNQVVADQDFVDRDLLGHFVVQLSAKAVNQVDPTAHVLFTAVDVLNDHIARRNELGAVLLRADQYASFSTITLPDVYVTIVSQPFASQADGKQFCTDHGLALNDCLAKKDPLHR